MSSAKKYAATDFMKPGKLPPLREAPSAADGYDPERAAYNEYLWCSQDDLLRARDRQIEENIRMLCGDQWIQWSKMRGRFVNLLDMMDDDEKRWRHMPVLNRLFLWFVLLHARMTENPPVLSWQPGPDRIDALLAEVCDPVFKYLWRDTQMLEVLDRLISWMIPSGRAHLKSRLDPMKGDPIPQRGPAKLQLLGPDGQPIRGDDQQPIHRLLEDVPYAPNGDGQFVPAAQLMGDESGAEQLQPVDGLEPQTLYEGGIEVDVLLATEVRGEWGHHIPWHRKQFHVQKSLVTPMQAWETWGIELEPDVRGQEAENSASLWRLLQTAGLFGATDGKRGDVGSEQEFCTIYESWHRPGRLKGTERTKESAGGRLLITTGAGVVLRDGTRPAKFRYTSPIRVFDFVGLPGRPSGTSAQEFLNGPVKTRNRLFAQKLGHATLASNPIRVVDSSQGLKEGDVPNIPGAEVVADRSNAKVMPIEYVNVPALGRDVDDAADRLRDEIDQMGQISGTEAVPPSVDPSGELVKELRFNSDRPIAATMRRMVIELGRLAEDWMALAPIIWDQEKIIQIAGEDSISRTITVYPELFREGSVNVEPEIESMLPEGRGERQARAKDFLALGVWGDPATPQAVMGYLDHARFPHLSRLSRPGGADRATAEQNVGKLMQGTPAAKLPLFPWYEFPLHRFVLEQVMKAPEFLRFAPEIQAQFVAFWQMLLDAESEQAMLASARTLDVETEQTREQLTRQVALKPLADAAQPANDAGVGGRSGGKAPTPSKSPTPEPAVA